MTYHPVTPANLSLVTDASVQPLHQHDCSHCQFLGRYSQDDTELDLYAHSSDDGSSSTVIARWSSDGPAYSSGSVFSYGRIPALMEARHRAEALGILKYDIYEAMAYAEPDSKEFERVQHEIVFTPEYLAYQAHVSGNFDQRNGIIAKLVDVELSLARKYKPETFRVTAMFSVEQRIAKIIALPGNLTQLQAWEAASAMFSIEWDNIPVPASSDLAQ